MLSLPGTKNVFRERFSLLCQNGFQEKVYLHTDRSPYVAGEYIWFRAFRTDAATHQPALYSRFVYVELYDVRDRLVNRIKVMKGALSADSGCSLEFRDNACFIFCIFIGYLNKFIILLAFRECFFIHFKGLSEIGI